MLIKREKVKTTESTVLTQGAEASKMKKSLFKERIATLLSFILAESQGFLRVEIEKIKNSERTST
ncbi:MAG: hypothetical protein JSU78_05370 [Deltaproteobacteria bacterium]|nr:MAG: hypothetical protein JSU78_05370 [Deltaproteobacteria bacterium]